VGKKKKRERKPIPDWWKAVDREMRLYLTWERVIKQQEDIILTHRLTGLRTTPVYELREGTPGGPTTYEVEKIAMDIDFAERKIAAGMAYRANIEEIAREAAGGDPAKETFIHRYWLTVRNLGIKGRIAMVLDALPSLACQNWETGQRTRPSRNFYVWREKMYDELGELLGHK